MVAQTLIDAFFWGVAHAVCFIFVPVFGLKSRS
jgi:predicted cobalt transporter CbtA